MEQNTRIPSVSSSTRSGGADVKLRFVRRNTSACSWPQNEVFLREKRGPRVTWRVLHPLGAGGNFSTCLQAGAGFCWWPASNPVSGERSAFAIAGIYRYFGQHRPKHLLASSQSFIERFFSANPPTQAHLMLPRLPTQYAARTRLHVRSGAVPASILNKAAPLYCAFHAADFSLTSFSGF